MRFSLFCHATVVFFLLASPAFGSNLQQDVHERLGARQFPAADALAKSALVAADASGSPERQFEALDLLIESAVLQHRLTAEETLVWIDRALALSKDGGRRAMLLAARASAYALQPDAASLKSAQETLGAALDAVKHAPAATSAADEAYVYQVSADILIDSGNFAEGEAALKHAVQLLLPSTAAYEESRLALLLARLGSLQQQLAHLDESKANLDHALAIAARRSGEHGTLYALVQTHQGIVQFFRNECLDAREVFQSVLKTLDGVDGEQYPALYASVFLGNTLVCLGSNQEGKAILKNAIARTQGDAQHFRANELNSLSIAERRLGDEKAAAELLAEAIRLDTGRYGEKTPRLLSRLVNLSAVQADIGDVAGAEQSLAHASELAGGNPLAESNIHRMLGRIELAKAEPAKAADDFATSIQDRTRATSANDPTVIGTQCEQAVAVARSGAYDQAYRLARDAEQSRVRLLQGVLPALSGQRASDFKALWDGCPGTLLALTLRSKDAQRTLETWSLLSGSRLLGTRLEAARLAYARGLDSDVQIAQFKRWQAAADKYSEALLKDTALAGSVEGARTAYETAESAIGSGETTARSPPTLHDLLLKLPTRDVLVAYVSTDDVDLSADSRVGRSTSKALYAFVTDRHSTRLVSLGPTTAIDTAVATWSALLRDPASDIAQLNEAGAHVRHLVWDPLGLGADGRQVLVVPSGPIFRVNFLALPDARGAYLVDHHWRVHAFESESDLELTGSAQHGSNRLLLVGSSNFGAIDSTFASERGCAAGFGPLPGVADELERLAVLWHKAGHDKLTLLKDERATKDALRGNVADAEVVHFATHAVDLNHCQNARTAARGVSLSKGAEAPISGALALFNANRYFNEGDTTGILTAEEIAALDLSRTQLVVLAACDTAGGKITSDEGVFGLRRAFRLAGAKSLVMSLWPVDDASTQQFMEHFYDARFVHKRSTADALAQAALESRDARHAGADKTHPFYWASFVASGAL